MATTTTNFGWDIPQSTDLVKDGATAIAALGQDIDTSMVDLKGGTTGQVLSKASNTDMDFTWVAQDDSNAIQNSIVDAKGDLITATANDTPARLAVGNNGEQLLADSTNTSGLRWTATPSASNPVLNSAMNVWQRGTSIAVTSGTAITYTADRWCYQNSASGVSATISRQATGDTTNLPNIQYCMRVQRTAGNTNTNPLYLCQNIETVNSIPFAGKTVTLSFYARKGANYSSTGDAFSVQLSQGTGTDENRLSGYTGQSTVLTGTATLTTTWQRFSFTGTIATNTTELAIFPYYAGNGTAGANDYFEITGVQIDIGNVALPYRAYGATYQAELAACQRYYAKSYAQGTAPATASTTNGCINFISISTTPTNNRNSIRLPVTMRTTPTVTVYSTSTGTSGQLYDESNATDRPVTVYYIGEQGFNYYVTSGTMGATFYNLLIQYAASAEL